MLCFKNIAFIKIITIFKSFKRFLSEIWQFLFKRESCTGSEVFEGVGKLRDK